MKKSWCRLFMLFVMLHICIIINAQDEYFKYGDLYYSKISETEVELSSWSGDEPLFVSHRIIPEEVVYNGRIYKVTCIGNYASFFAETIELPSSISKIKENAFGENGLKAVYINDLAKWCEIDFSVGEVNHSTFDPQGYNDFYSNPLARGADLYLNGELVTDLVIPDGVSHISDLAFYGGHFNSVTIPNSVKTIGKLAFTMDENSVLTIGKSVSKIGSFTFPFCYAKEIEIKNPNVLIEERAFSGSKLWDTNITIGTVETVQNPITEFEDDLFIGRLGGNSVYSITLGKYVKTVVGIEYYARREELRDMIKNIFVEPENPYYASLDGILYDKEFTTLICCPGGWMNYNIDRMTLTIPETVTAISDCAFLGGSISSITLPDGLKYIGDSALDFSGRIIYGAGIFNSLISIGGYSFCGEEIKTLELPNVEYIGKSAFEGCRELTKINIYNSATDIDEKAFARCPNLASITIGSSKTNVDNVGTIQSFEKENNSTLSDTGIKIGAKAFSECDKIVEVNCYSQVPPIATEDIFTETVYANATLTVPVGSALEYQSVAPWNKFVNTREFTLTGIEKVVNDNNISVLATNNEIIVKGIYEGTLIEVYSLSGQLLYVGKNTVITVPSKGFYFVKIKGNTYKIFM